MMMVTISFPRLIKMEIETESVEVRKTLLDRAKKLVEKYPVFYDSIEEFVESAVREEVIRLRTMEGKH